MIEELYQEFIIERYKHPRNFGTLNGATHSAELHNTTCGDHIKLALKVSDGKVVDSKFIGKGCAISQASASLLTTNIKGKTFSQVKKLTKDDVLALIKLDLSKNPSRMKCALLVFDVLKSL